MPERLECGLVKNWNGEGFLERETHVEFFIYIFIPICKFMPPF
jgi:hypothetical protein